MLVGRGDVLAQVREAIGAAQGGQGSLVLLLGEPGIGKTRLSQEVASRAVEHGFAARWTSCWDGEGAPAFWPWVQFLRSHAGATPPEQLLEEAGPGAADLARFIPGFAGGSFGSPGRDPTPEDRFRLFDAVASLLERAAAKQPLLVILDDLHFADASSVDLLRFVGSRVQGSRVLLLGTRRIGEPGPGPVDDALTGLSVAADTIELHGLDRREVAELIETVTDHPADQRLVDMVHLRTGGNPLFVREVSRMLLAQGRTADPKAAPPPVPAALKPVISRRLGFLSEACRTFLEIAAVSGTTFDASQVAALAGFGEYSPLIDEAVGHGILLPDTGAGSVHQFAHGILRDVVYASIDSGRRASLHRSVGAALARSRSPSPDELLMHFVRAGTPDDLRRALEHAESAAERALEMLAFDEAAALTARGLEIADRIEAGDGVRTRLLLLRGDALNRTGDVTAARSAFLQAARMARPAGDAEALARAALGCAYSPQLEMLTQWDPVAARLLEEAISVAEAESVTGVLLRTALAYASYYVDPDAYQRLTREALDAARRLDDPRALGQALELSMFLGGEHAGERLGIGAEMVRIGQAYSLPDIEMRGHVRRVFDLLETGDVAGADEEIAATERLIETAGMQSHRWYPALWRAMRALLDGRLDDAEHLAAEALHAGQPQGQGAVDHYGIQLMAVRLEQGRLGELVDGIKANAERYPEIPAFRCALAMAYATSGQRSAARAELDRLSADGFAVIRRDYNLTASLMLLSITCALVGDADQAEALMERWKGFEERFVVVAYSAICAGAVAHHLGRLAEVAGRDEEAIAYLEDALVRQQRAGAVAWNVRTQIALGRLLAERDAQRSRDLLQRARATAEELGLVSALAELDSEPESKVSENIFRREGELWTLAFEDRTVHVRDSKGVRDLARLLSAPVQELHALDLVAGGVPVPVQGPGVEVADGQALDAYRSRIGELREEIEEAESFDDAVRAERARTELDELTDALASAYGLGGRRRKSGDAGERARKAVTERIRAGIKRITDAHPELGAHLDRSINTGTFCSYTPDRPIRWVT